jgi:hypothetical protein
MDRLAAGELDIDVLDASVERELGPTLSTGGSSASRRSVKVHVIVELPLQANRNFATLKRLANS